MAIYFNPTFKPEYFYPIIKPLCLLYDQIVIWSPIAEQLRIYGNFSPDEFTQACESQNGNLPVIIPSARDTWFNRNLRSHHPDEDAHDCNSFDETIYNIAYSNNTIIPSNYDNGYKILDTLLESPRQRNKIYEIAHEKIEPKLPEKFILRLDQVAEQQNKDRTWAIANSYIQDVDALIRININCRQLNKSQSLRPLVAPDQIDGYLFVSPTNYTEYSEKIALRELQEHIQYNKSLPEISTSLSPQEVKNFMDEAYNASQLSWKEIMKMREARKDIREWLKSASWELKRRNIGEPTSQSISQIAYDQAFASSILSQMGLDVFSVLFGISTGYTGNNLSSGMMTIAGLSLAKFYTPIYKNIAKLLAGKARILIDTPYFPQTGVLGMCELVKQFRKQNMTENSSRIINTTTYNEFGTVISHNFVQGSYNINMNQDLTEAASKIQELIQQLQSQGLAVDVAQEHVAQDIAKQVQNNQNMRGMLVKWGQSLADNAAKTTVSDIVQGTVKLALRASGIPLP